MTGYSKSYAVGKKPAFLQGEKTSPSFKKQIRSDLKNNHSYSGSLVNYKKNGQAYIGKIQKNIKSGTGSMIMTNLRWRKGDSDKNKAHKNWEMIVHEPTKFVKAYDKFIKAIGDVLGGRLVTLESIDMGGLGGTHNTWLSGTNLNDLILTERAIQKTKAFQDFIAERGKVEIIKNYLSNNIHVFR